jgi:hypothetical protein
LAIQDTEAKRKLVALLYAGGCMARRVEKRTRVSAPYHPRLV